ncbi:MAG TPA: hypothetical protein VJ781_01375 [Pyrinomonadaceae bacterium]|nr:hypothetical protein [Pyrinomonadaceae bacterium]
MLNERGRETDLDVIDAVDRLPNGRDDVWLKDERPVITRDPKEYELWIEHIRSKENGSV